MHELQGVELQPQRSPNTIGLYNWYGVLDLREIHDLRGLLYPFAKSLAYRSPRLDACYVDDRHMIVVQ